MPLTSDIGSRSFNLGLEVFRARIAANGRGDITVGGEMKLSVLCMMLLMGAFHPVAVMTDCFLSY